MIAPIIYNDNDLEIIEQFMHEIAELDGDFQETEKTHGNYYIGGVQYDKHTDKQLLLMSAISPRAFFSYNYHMVSIYLHEMCISDIHYFPNIQVLQLDISADGCYRVIMKTYWLRLIQRTWKRVYAEKMAMIRRRGSIMSLRYNETHGHYPDGLRRLPELYGMLSFIKRH
jgi:hypothetical protein